MTKKKKKVDCEMLDRIVTLEADNRWLKRGYYVQVLFSAGTFATVFAMALKFLGVV